MSTAKEQLQILNQGYYDLNRARSTVNNTLKALWQSLWPRVQAHQRVIRGIFQEAGQDALYKERFGLTGGGHLESADVVKDKLLLQIGYSCRGYVDYEEFQLPLAYLEEDWETQLEKDAAHYRKAFERLGALTAAQDKRTERERELELLAQLKEKYETN